MPPEPPEFFLDRGLGRRVAEGLAELGWHVHRAAEHFPDDAQDVEDEVWLTYGLGRGWSPLCEDGRTKGRHVERAPLEVHGGVLFHLDNQRLLVSEMIARFTGHGSRSIEPSSVAGPRAYAVGEAGIRPTWP